jgi:hypothetical protein
MYSIVCVSLSYDTRNVFSLFSVKYMGSYPQNRKTVLGQVTVLVPVPALYLDHKKQFSKKIVKKSCLFNNDNRSSIVA